MLRNIGLPEILLLVLLFVLVFGSSKLPGVAANLAKALKKFRKASDEEVGKDEKDSKSSAESKSDKNKD